MFSYLSLPTYIKKNSLLACLIIIMTAISASPQRGLHVAEANAQAQDAPFVPHSYPLSVSGLGSKDAFGRSVAMKGDALFVGAPEEQDSDPAAKGRVEVFRKDANGVWTSSQTLRPNPTSGRREYFGWALATNGLFTAVSGQSSTWDQAGQFPVWIYRRSSTGSYELAHEIPVPQSNIQAMKAMGFGYSLAMDGNLLVVGAPNTSIMDRDAGRGYVAGGMAYIYRYDDQLGQYTLLQPLLAPIFDGDMRFGISVALDNDTLVVGARRNWEEDGIAFVYKEDAASGTWAYSATLTSSNSTTRERFGESVAIDGTVIAVGAPRHDYVDASGNRQDSTGAVYLFSYNPVLDSWTEREMVENIDNFTEFETQQFGRAVHYRDNTLVVTAPLMLPRSIPHRAGSAFIYTCDANLQCSEEIELYPFNAWEPDEYFGMSLAVDDGTIVIGAPYATREAFLSGSTYVFNRPRMAWVWAHQPTTAQYTPSGSDYAYSSVGDGITVTRTAVGRYTVNFGKVMEGVRGTVLVSQYDTSNDGTCGLHVWSGTNVYVRCYDRTGALKDAEFRAMFYGVWGYHQGLGMSMDRRESYLWNNLDNSTGVPNSGYQMSPVGATHEVTYRGTGQYKVKVSGVWKSGESPHALVTPYGDQPRYCQSNSWSLYPDYANLYINCYDMQGNLRDARFTLQFFSRYVPSGHGAFLRNFSPSSSQYTPTSGYQWNSTGGVSYVERISQGAYWVHLPGLSGAGGMAQANSYSSTNHRCHAEGMWNQGNEKIVAVYCRTPTGTPVDNKFSLLYLHDPAANN